MRFNEYREATNLTAMYPGKGLPLGAIYCALKLAGEAGEVIVEVDKALKGEVTNLEVALELGDVTWYVAQLAETWGLDLDHGLTDTLCPSCLSKTIVVSATAVSELLGKALRDDAYTQRESQGDGLAWVPLTAQRKLALQTQLNNILTAVDNMSRLMGGDIGQVYETNLEKLRDRAARGKLQGSGSKR